MRSETEIRSWGIVLIALAVIALSGCGGGGGGSSSSPPAPSSNWDSLVWDQSNWR